MNVRKLRDVPRYRKTFVYRVDTWFELCFYRHRFLRPWRFIVLSHMYVHIYIYISFSSLFFFFSSISIYSLTVHEYSYDFFPRVVVKYLAVKSLCSETGANHVASIPFVNLFFFLVLFFFLLRVFFFFFSTKFVQFFTIRRSEHRWNGLEQRKRKCNWNERHVSEKWKQSSRWKRINVKDFECRFCEDIDGRMFKNWILFV